MKVAVYIMSCDKTYDVLNHFIIGLKKYWGDCPLDIYIGTNSVNPKINLVGSVILPVEKSNWKTETLDQLERLRIKDSTVSHLIVFLDDFVLSNPISNDRIMKICRYKNLDQIKYLRLKRLEEGILMKSLQWFKKKTYVNTESFFRIRKEHPYFSSLQVALWELGHLTDTVKLATDIWNFESVKFKSIEHYSVIDSIVKYRHIVQKGMWEIYSKKYCIKTIGYFNPGNRPFKPDNLTNIVLYYISQFRFFLFGYFFLTFKRRFNR